MLRSLPICCVESDRCNYHRSHSGNGSYVLTSAPIRLDNAQVSECMRNFSDLTTYEGEQVHFEVEVRSDPPPTLTGIRDGEVIRDSAVLFYISEVFMEYQGLFIFVRHPTRPDRLTVGPRPQQ